jgi:hypothetical protein
LYDWQVSHLSVYQRFDDATILFDFDDRRFPDFPAKRLTPSQEFDDRIVFPSTSYSAANIASFFESSMDCVPGER